MNHQFEAVLVETDRLRLYAPTRTLLEAEVAGRRMLTRALGARVPVAWPPALLEGVAPIFLSNVIEDPDSGPWLGWYWVKKSCARETSTLIAMGGFKGEPDASGTIEIGYSVLGPYRGQGYATEGVGGLTRWAMGIDGVHRIVARVLETNLASTRVLEKNGYRCIGEDREELLYLFDEEHISDEDDADR